MYKQIREQDPLKQGLKPWGAAQKRERRTVYEFVSKIH